MAAAAGNKRRSEFKMKWGFWLTCSFSSISSSEVFDE
jgi:hypothetical protein